jgi:outer membrane autotransporter protein
MLGGAACAVLLADPALSQNATWLATPGSNDFNTSSNWTPATVPSGTAFFDATNRTSVTIGAPTTIGDISFGALAPAYTITIDAAASLTLTGTGIANNSGQSQRLVNGGTFRVEADADLAIDLVMAGGQFQIADTPAFVTLGSLAGAGMVAIGSGSALLVGTGIGSTVFSGQIQGNGSFGTFGPGSLALTGAGSTIGGSLSICSCSTGTLSIRGGSLAVGDDIVVQGGALVVEQGGTLTNTTQFVLGGTFTVDGAGSSASVGSLLANQPATTSRLTVSNGATLTTLGASLDAATFFGVPGSVIATVTGAGSRWTVNSVGGLSIGLGSNGPVTVSVAEGGRLVASQIAIASNGTLNIGLGGLAGGIDRIGPDPTNIDHDGAIVANFSDAMTLSANILANDPASPGTLTKRGTGTLTLTGTNTYLGTTTIEGGVISVASDTNLGDVTSTLALNGGVLRVTGTAFTQTARPITFGGNGGGFDIADAGNSFTLTQSFAGPGGLSKAGAGTLRLTGAQSYLGATTVGGGVLLAGAAGAFSPSSAFTVAAGATLSLGGFAQSIGSLAGAGTVALGAASLAAGSDGTSTAFSGALTGSGGFTKQGTGTLTLSGTGSLTGPTTLQAGMLVVNGSLAGSVVTVNGGTLGGSGTVGGINAASGTVAPGNSIGTLAVAGNVAFGPGSTYRVEANAAGQADRISATGTALLTGGTVQVLAEQGEYGLATRYVILSAQGGVGGTFAGLTSNLAFLTPSLGYTTTEVVLTLARNDVGFVARPGVPGIAVTRNQTGVARVAETLGFGNRVYDALLSSTVAEARAGFDALSGEAHAQTVSVAIETSHLIRETVLNRLRAPFATVPQGTVSGGFSADMPGRPRATQLPASGLDSRRVSLWGEAIGGQGRNDADGNAASLGRRGGGLMLGAEFEQPFGHVPWRVGVAGGFTRTRFELDARRSDGTQDSGHAALYAGARLGQVNLRAGAAYSWNETEITRLVGLRSLSDRLSFEGRGATAQAFGEVGYALALNDVALEPFAQLAAVSVRTESGTERGGPAALTVTGRDQSLGFSTLGLRAETRLGATPLFARAMLGWRHAFGQTTPTAVLAFASGSGRYRVHATPVARDALVAEAGLTWRVAGNASLGLSYGATLSEAARDQTLRGRLDIAF